MLPADSVKPAVGPINQPDRITALESGEVEMVVATLSITDERKQKIDFAGPYFVAHRTCSSGATTSSCATESTAEHCSVTGTTSAAYVKANFKGDITLREVPTYSECVRNLADSTVDAVTTNDLILAGFAATPQIKGLLKVVGKGFTDETYGIGVKKGNTELVGKINAALKEYVLREPGRTLDEGPLNRSLKMPIHRRWAGSDREAAGAPGIPAAVQLGAGRGARSDRRRGRDHGVCRRRTRSERVRHPPHRPSMSSSPGRSAPGWTPGAWTARRTKCSGQVVFGFFCSAHRADDRPASPRARAGCGSRIPAAEATAAFVTPAGARFLAERMAGLSRRRRQEHRVRNRGGLADTDPLVVDPGLLPRPTSPAS